MGRTDGVLRRVLVFVHRPSVLNLWIRGRAKKIGQKWEGRAPGFRWSRISQLFASSLHMHPSNNGTSTGIQSTMKVAMRLGGSSNLFLHTIPVGSSSNGTVCSAPSDCNRFRNDTSSLLLYSSVQYSLFMQNVPKCKEMRRRRRATTKWPEQDVCSLLRYYRMNVYHYDCIYKFWRGCF